MAILGYLHCHIFQNQLVNFYKNKITFKSLPEFLLNLILVSQSHYSKVPGFLPGKTSGQRSLGGLQSYSSQSWGQKRVGHYLATKQQPNKPQVQRLEQPKIFSHSSGVQKSKIKLSIGPCSLFEGPKGGFFFAFFLASSGC